MSAKTIRNVLALLQDEPENEAAWKDLADALRDPGDIDRPELGELLYGARRAYEARREYDAVARLLTLEIGIFQGTAEEADLVAEQARVLDEEILDDAASSAAYARLLELRPNDTRAQEALERAKGRRGKWLELTKRYIEESKGAGEPSFKSSLLVSAAEVAYRYGRPALAADEAKKEGEAKAKAKKKVDGLDNQILEGLTRALDADPKNRRAGLLLERVYRERGNLEGLVKVLGHLGSEGHAKEERVAALLRLARAEKRRGEKRAAIQAYERVLDLAPGNQEATSALVEHFNTNEDWDHLVALYEEQLSVRGRGGASDAGMLLQLGMVHWKMRGRPAQAEPFFERLRKVEPAHPTVLEFFRTFLGEQGDNARLAGVLGDAQRVMADGPQRSALVAELARLSEDGANATKAIEQWRALLRQDPSNQNARDSLRRLYRQTASWNALADLLRGDLERVPQDQTDARLKLLREVAEIYGQHLKNDSALVTVLTQITALDGADIDALRELVRVYASLGRARDLLTAQERLAEVEKDPEAKAVLYRDVARRWLEQFSNVQNAMEAYEKLLAAVPSDPEANEKLKELYTKRRAYKPLFALLGREAERTTDAGARHAVWMEMARLASERLEQGADAMALYKRILSEDPGSGAALDALEKQAERDKDFATVADALERRVDQIEEMQSRLATLQKLGAIYTDRLHDDAAAARAFRRVLELQPGHPKALRVLRESLLAAGDYDAVTQLYAQGRDWEGLAEVLSNAADKAQDKDQRIELSYRAADVYVDKLGTPERAQRAYERVLAVRPDDRRAAQALVPLYEAEEKWNRLAPLYEALLAHAEGDDERLVLEQKLARVLGDRLQDKKGAFAWARKAYELDPEREGSLADLEASARASLEWEGFLEVLTARAKGKKGKKEEKLRLRRKIASTYNELGRTEEAITAYEALVDDDDEDEESALALDRLLRQTQKHDALRALFERRVERANTAQKIQLLNEWAQLEEDVLGAPERAVGVYKKLLEIVPQHGGALRATARLLRSTGDAEGAASALERDRDQREGLERAQREVELARLYIVSLKRPTDALAAAKRALELAIPAAGSAPSHELASAVDVIEELLQIPETRGRAAELLDAAYVATKNPAKRAEVLEVMIATAAAKGDRIQLFERLADLKEKDLGDKVGAFHVVARAAVEFPAELPLWDRLGVLANRTDRFQAFVQAIVDAVPEQGETGLPVAVELDLAERAATLYDERLGEIERARPYLERILRHDPENERAFLRLKQILTTLERWTELEGVYERVITATKDDARRAELLSEVALVAEEIIGDRPKAAVYYERILALDPEHDQAAHALDSIYAAEGRWESLAALLRARLERATMDQAPALKLRLGTLYVTRLGDPKTALGFLEEVLQAEPSERDARDLVEGLLDNPELRSRAAAVLEAVYVAQDAARDLVRILEIRLETARQTTDRRELLRRIAELKDERLQEGAFEAYARLVPLAPDDAHARERLLELARKMGAHEEAARVLVESAAAAQVPEPRGEILGEVARLYEERLDDTLRAKEIYKQILELDPDNVELTLPAARALERIYEGTGESAELVKILRIEVKLEEDAARRHELLAKLGTLSENALGDPRGAIEAWKSRLDDDPLDEAALAALDRLYERTSEWRPLVEVLRARERHTDDAKARRALMLRAAVILADKLSDVNEAILAYRAVLDEFGPERGVLAAIATLYEVADRHQDLAETLEMDLGLAESTEDRLALLARLAEVQETRLKEVPTALETYRQALALDTSHAPSRKALERLTSDENVRREAASILRPLYEAEGAHEALLRVLDIEAEFEETVDGKLALFEQAARVAEQDLHDPKRAFAYAARGLRASAGEAELPTWLERAERLASATSAHGELVALLEEVAPGIDDENAQLETLLKIAVLAREKLADADKARTYYVKALELRGDDARALKALEELYGEAKDWPALLDILRKRAENAPDDAERRRILFKDAELSANELADPKGAIEVYEEILAIGPEPRAFAALEKLYAETEAHDRLVDLYERQVALGGPADQRASLHHRLGGVLHEKLGDTERAFEQYEEALRLDGQHGGTVAALEALMADKQHALRAAEMLEQVYLTRLDWRRVMTTIEARLEVSQDPDERRTLLRRLAKLYEEQEENYRAALETTAKLLAEDVTDEPTWAELERFARVANAEARLAEIFAGELEKLKSDEAATARLSFRTGELFEVQGDLERALGFYRRAYAFAPDEQKEAFRAVDRLLATLKRPKERVELYRGALEHRDQPEEQLATLHTIADLEEREVGDEEAAIETYRQALEVEETDARSLDALTRLYERRERTADLAELLRKRAEQSALPEDEAKYRLDLGKLLQRTGDVALAIDEYQNVVEVAPGSRLAGEAVQALQKLLESAEHKARVADILRPIYEGADDWKQLISLNAERLAIARDDDERVVILRESARLWEERGRDVERAFDSVRDAFVLDPGDGESRAELDRLAGLARGGKGRWDDLADAYEQGIEKSPDDLGKKELLSALARLHDQRRDDPRRALDAWERLFKLDETDIAPLEEMDALATLLSDWPTLVRVLAKKAELTPNDEDRASTWRRIGEARRDMLDDPQGAIDAYERALELEPDSAFSIDNLIRLYEDKNDSARLVDLYRRRVELCGEDDEGLKFVLLTDMATRYERGLNDRRAAIEALHEALTVKPNEPEVVGRLGVLYAEEKMWPELLENLRSQAASAGEGEPRRALQRRIGALLAKELEEPRQALEAYRDMLVEGYDEEAARALQQLGETRDELRLETAEALEPVLRGAEKFTQLLEVLELRLRAETEHGDRAATLVAMADVAETHFHDARRAEDLLLRALEEQPSDASLHDRIERLAEQAGREGWQRYADALSDRIASVFDAEANADLGVRLGRVAEEKLEDLARAAKAYTTAGEQRGDDTAILTALDRLFGKLGDARSLADVLERRIGLEADARVQAELHHRLAALQIEEFKEPSRGLSTLRVALEKLPDHEPSRAGMERLLDDGTLFEEAFEVLESVYRQLDRNEDLAKIYERRVGRAQGKRDTNRARLDLAKILEDNVKDPARAQRVVEAALAVEVTDEEILAELERLAGISAEGYARAAEALEAALKAHAEDVAAPARAALWSRLAGWRRTHLSDLVGAERALDAARAADPEDLETLRALEEVRRAPGRERDLVETLRARAALESSLETKRELLREAKEIAEVKLSDVALAEACLRATLAENDADAWALAELTRLREAAGDKAEVITLLLRRAEVEADGKVVSDLRHRAARALEEEGNSARAIELYEGLFEDDPSDAQAAARLRELYPKADRARDLVRLLERLVDTAESKDDRAELRLALAAQLEKLGDNAEATQAYRAILDEEPGHLRAVRALSELLERTDRHEDLAELLSGEIERARDRGDTAQELSIRVRQGEVYEGKLADPARALAAYESILERDAHHQGALEAVARLAEARSDWDKAAGALARLVEVATGPEGVPWATRLVEARRKLGDDAGVLAALRRALELDPRHVATRTALAEHYTRTKNHEALAAHLVDDADWITKDYPDEVVPPAPAPAAGSSMRPAAPGASIRPGTSMRPGSLPPPPPVSSRVVEVTSLLRRAAEIHLNDRHAPGDAAPLLERATTLLPQERDLLLLLCEAYSAAGREREAAGVLERIIASFGAKRTKELSGYHHRLATLLNKLGDKELALAQLEMAFKVDPGSIAVLRDLGVLAFETNDMDRAQKTFRALLLQRLDAAAGITKGEVFCYLGEISQKQGDKAKARQMFERALENEPGLQRAKERLAETKA